MSDTTILNIGKKRSSYKPKELKFVHSCKICNQEFKSADVKSIYCLTCKEPRECKCGCGKLVKTPGFEYYTNHSKIGKSYKEIYGTSTPRCGFQQGDKNIAKKPDIKQKISDSVKKSYTPALRQQRYDQCYFLSHKYASFIKRHESFNGDKFRSKFEVDVANFLQTNDYSYEYERIVQMNTGNRKIVDFVVNDFFIEVTGYAFEDWKKTFNEKLKLLHASVSNKIIVITYEKHIPELKNFFLENDLSDIILLDNNNLHKLKTIL